MIVAAYIEQAFEEYMSQATEVQKELLLKECNDLLVWGERHAEQIDVPERRTEVLNRVYNLESGPFEIPVEIVIWPVDRVNKVFLPELDKRITETYKALKVARFQRPSIVMSCGYFRHMVSINRGNKYLENPAVWASVYLVHQRLESTCRLAVRYEMPDRFGPRVTYLKNGGILVEYTKNAWRRALVTRGVVSNKTIGGKDAGRRSTVSRGEMRQVSGFVSSEESRQERRGVGGKAVYDVQGVVQNRKRRKGARGVQRDMSTLPFSFADVGQKNGKGG